MRTARDVEPERLEHKPTSPGAAVTLRVDNKQYSGKLAVVLGEDPDGRVRVFVHKHRTAVRVKTEALVPFHKSVPKFPSAFEVSSIHSYRMLHLLRKMGLPRPHVLVVEPETDAVPLLCHQNAMDAAARTGGTAVFGYSLMPALTCQCITFECHSVLRMPNGRLVDVTPDIHGEKAKFFVEETSFSWAAYYNAVVLGTAPAGKILPLDDAVNGYPVFRCGAAHCDNGKFMVPDGVDIQDVARKILERNFVQHDLMNGTPCIPVFRCHTSYGGHGKFQAPDGMDPQDLALQMSEEVFVRRADLAHRFPRV
tara:strand:- start:73 stop:999 length:927 start_codon:yes stop_codon:yes gene_type:complete